MALRRLAQQDHNANLAGCGAGDEPALPVDSRRMQHLAAAVGTLPRGRRQVRARSGAGGSALPAQLLATGPAASAEAPQGPPGFPAGPDLVLGG